MTFSVLKVPEKLTVAFDLENHTCIFFKDTYMKNYLAETWTQTTIRKELQKLRNKMEIFFFFAWSKREGKKGSAQQPAAIHFRNYRTSWTEFFISAHSALPATVRISVFASHSTGRQRQKNLPRKERWTGQTLCSRMTDSSIQPAPAMCVKNTVLTRTAKLPPLHTWATCYDWTKPGKTNLLSPCSGEYLGCKFWLPTA